MSATNSDGFIWGPNQNTSVVKQHPTNGPTETYYNGITSSIYSKLMPDGTTRNWTANDQQHSLRFHYKAGEEWTEQWFGLNKQLTDIWIGYWLRVPTNFSYGTSPTRSNNKFFALWMDGYSSKGAGSTVWLGMEPHNTTGATLGFTFSTGNNRVAEGFRQHTPFISTADRGRWMHIILHVKAESTEGANDGIIQTYRRWKNEEGYTKLHETLDAPLRIPDSVAGFNEGYILGWANRPYDVDTEWLLDNFTTSTTSLLTNRPSRPKPLIAE